MATMTHAQFPLFQHIVNYPTFIAPRGRKRRRTRSDKEPPAGAAADETKRGCVMCGRHCLTSAIQKGKFGGRQGYNVTEENLAINNARSHDQVVQGLQELQDVGQLRQQGPPHQEQDAEQALRRAKG